MDITLVGFPSEIMSSFLPEFPSSGPKFEDPPSTDLIDNHGNVSGDYLDWGCVSYFDTSMSSGTDAGYSSWMDGATYFHTKYGTIWDQSEWSVSGQGVETQGLSFNVWSESISLHIEYTRAVTLDRAETWTAQYFYAGQNAGTVVTTFSPTGEGNIYATNADGDLVYNKRFL